MNPAPNSGFTESIAGDPYTEELIGPTSGIWGRGAGEYGRVAFLVALPPRRPTGSPGQAGFCPWNSSDVLCVCLTARTLRAAESAPLRSSH
jgi:hypothetical protein